MVRRNHNYNVGKRCHFGQTFWQHPQKLGVEFLRPRGLAINPVRLSGQRERRDRPPVHPPAFVFRHRLDSRLVEACILRRLRHLRRFLEFSSAESECYALTKGECSGLGLQSLFADWNLKLQLSLHMDSSSAKAVASRRGTGKSIRHVQTRVLYRNVLQQNTCEL